MEEVSEVPMLPPRRKDAHKGDFGRVLVVAGSLGMTGAAMFCCRAALRCGCGLVKLITPASLNHIFEAALPEVVTRCAPDTNGVLKHEALKIILEEASQHQVLALGPGLSNTASIRRLVCDVLRRTEIPIVLDADGINAVAQQPQVLLDHRGPVVVTPHPGEMARLVSKTTKQVQKNRQTVAVTFARAFGCVVALKGYRTVVTDGERVYTNTTGNSGMATAASGDVLTGVIASLIAQGMTAMDAAVVGVYLHGLAGDIAARRLTEYSVTASDILDSLPRAIAHHVGWHTAEEEVGES